MLPVPVGYKKGIVKLERKFATSRRSSTLVLTELVGLSRNSFTFPLPLFRREGATGGRRQVRNTCVRKFKENPRHGRFHKFPYSPACFSSSLILHVPRRTTYSSLLALLRSFSFSSDGSERSWWKFSFELLFPDFCERDSNVCLERLNAYLVDETDGIYRMEKKSIIPRFLRASSLRTNVQRQRVFRYGTKNSGQ